MFDRRLLQNFDWILLLLLILIAGISVANLYSATAAIRDAGGSQIFIKQVYWYLIGFSVLLLTTTFDYHLLERLAFPAYLLTLGLLVLVLLRALLGLLPMYLRLLRRRPLGEEGRRVLVRLVALAI